MKKSLSVWQMFGFVFVCVAGVILHFLFDLSGESIVVAPFSAVNESIWEHMKLLFFPMFGFTFVEKRYVGKTQENFYCVKLAGIVFGIVLIPGLYYTLNGILGTTPDWVNIFIFFFVAAVAFYLEKRLFDKKANCNSPKSAVLVLIIIAVAFAVFTFYPPCIPLFEDPVTKTYGYYQFLCM